MITIEKIDRAGEHRSCHECAALMHAELFNAPLYAVSLPAIGMRVMLCDRHARELEHKLFLVVPRSSRCERCHGAPPNPNGCARCNPERLAERLRAAVDELARLGDARAADESDTPLGESLSVLVERLHALRTAPLDPAGIERTVEQLISYTHGVALAARDTRDRLLRLEMRVAMDKELRRG